MATESRVDVTRDRCDTYGITVVDKRVYMEDLREKWPYGAAELERMASALGAAVMGDDDRDKGERLMRAIADGSIGGAMGDGERPAAHTVYFMQRVSGGPIKIGVTYDVTSRLRGMQTGSPEEIVLLGTMPGGEEHERALHRRFAAHRVRLEWFSPAQEILDYILANAGPAESVS